MKLIFLGAPGAGKGTQAEAAAARYNIPMISTGNILREAVKQGSESGLRAKVYMEAGKLVPDDLVISILKEAVAEPECSGGFILDGFPRTAAQAAALDGMGIAVDRVINIDVSDETIIKRMSGRRVCGDCAAGFHVDYMPSSAGDNCDKCGGKLVLRPDDAAEVVKKRLEVYHEQTEPLIGYYSKAGILRTVKGQEKVSDTTELTQRAIEGD